MRSFGSSIGILAASTFMQGCQLEPNLGIHGYYQRRTSEKLKGKQWICDAEQLLYADQEGNKASVACALECVRLIPCALERVRVRKGAL